MWLLHSLEGPDQLVQVSGDVAQGELQRSDDVFEAKQDEHIQLMTLVHICYQVALNSSHQMHKILKMDKINAAKSTHKSQRVWTEIRTSS